jgi:hypothetical protein
VRSVGASGPAALPQGTRPETPAVEDVLNLVVEDYMLGDLDSMRDHIPAKASGAVCYPMLLAVLAGSELLGELTSDRGDPLEHYWTEFMAKIDAKYASAAAIAKDLCRNGLAHVYLTKPGIGVVRGEPSRHLRRESESLLILDCLVLHEHFRQSYERHAGPAIRSSPKEPQRRLEKLMAHDHAKSKSLMSRLPEQFPIVP